MLARLLGVQRGLLVAAGLVVVASKRRVGGDAFVCFELLEQQRFRGAAISCSQMRLRQRDVEVEVLGM